MYTSVVSPLFPLDALPKPDDQVKKSTKWKDTTKGTLSKWWGATTNAFKSAATKVKSGWKKFWGGFGRKKKPAATATSVAVKITSVGVLSTPRAGH
jgi:hypothetical protein